MTKKKTAVPEYVTTKILKKEINRLDTKIDGVEQRLTVKIDGVEQRLDVKIDGVEQRLDAKIESTAQSFKEYSDIQTSLVRNEMRQNTMNLQQSIKQLGDKLDTSVSGLVNLIEQRVGEISAIHTMVEEHEKRIGVLEEKAG